MQSNFKIKILKSGTETVQRNILEVSVLIDKRETLDLFMDFNGGIGVLLTLQKKLITLGKGLINWLGLLSKLNETHQVEDWYWQHGIHLNLNRWLYLHAICCLNSMLQMIIVWAAFYIKEVATWVWEYHST